MLPESSRIKEKVGGRMSMLRRDERLMRKSTNPYINEHGSFNDYYFTL